MTNKRLTKEAYDRDVRHFELESLSSVSSSVQCLEVAVLVFERSECAYRYNFTCLLRFQFWHAQVIDFQVGDVLEILPGQNPSVVDAFLRRCNLDPDCCITVRHNLSCFL